MKMKTILCVFLTILTIIGLFTGEPVCFSGTWKLDESRLNPDEPLMAPVQVVVVKDSAGLSTEKLLSNPMMGDFTVFEKLMFDGKECISNMEMGGTRITTAVWSEDKKSQLILA